MTYTEPMSNPSKSSESSNSIWYIFLTSDCTNREEYGRVLQKVTLHTCPYNIHHIMYTKQGMVGKVRIWVEIGVHNYITTLTLTTKGTNTFLFFGEEDSMELDALETLFQLAPLASQLYCYIRSALLCVACDIPAGRKTCGFSSRFGCSRCWKKFSGTIGNMHYTDRIVCVTL